MVVNFRMFKVRVELQLAIETVKRMTYKDFCHYAVQGFNGELGSWVGLVMTRTHYEALEIRRDATFHTSGLLRIIDADGDVVED